VVLLRLQQSPTSAPGIRSQQLQHQQHHQRQSSAIESDREELKWLVRYLRARIEAIKAESEEDEEKESEEEEEEEVNRTGETNKACKQNQRGPRPADVIPTGAPSRHSNETKSQDSQDEIAITEKPPAFEVAGTGEDNLSNEPERVASLAPPTSSVFNFTPPSTSVQTFPGTPPTIRATPQGSTRRKIKGGGWGGATPSNNVTPVLVTPASASSVSSEEETRGQSPPPHTPSKRPSNRLGKRSSGRDKSSAVDLFGKNINAKRRRGMGDRRDDDRRDGGLH